MTISNFDYCRGQSTRPRKKDQPSRIYVLELQQRNVFGHFIHTIQRFHIENRVTRKLMITNKKREYVYTLHCYALECILYENDTFFYFSPPLSTFFHRFEHLGSVLLIGFVLLLGEFFHESAYSNWRNLQKYFHFELKNKIQFRWPLMLPTNFLYKDIYLFYFKKI